MTVKIKVSSQDGLIKCAIIFCIPIQQIGPLKMATMANKANEMKKKEEE